MECTTAHHDFGISVAPTMGGNGRLNEHPWRPGARGGRIPHRRASSSATHVQ